VSVCPPQILQLLTCDQSQVLAVTNHRLTAWGTTSNKKNVIYKHICFCVPYEGIREAEV
jgi:hypothetical protein